MKRLLFILSIFMLCVWQSEAQSTASVVWPLVSGSQTEASLSGQLDDPQFTLSGLVVKDYGGVDACIRLTTATGAWETTENPNLFIQFSITAKTGAIFDATNLLFLVGGAGGGNVRANFYYSKDPFFSDRKQIEFKVGGDLLRDQLEEVTISINEQVTDGDRLYFRIYPYYKSVTTGKYICLKGVTIGGVVTGGVIDLAEVSTVPAVSYISTTSALAGGTIIKDGGAKVSARGMAWSTSPNPTVDNFKSIEGDGSGTFESTLIGLLADTKYYARAYATNTTGTSYGNEISFTTLPYLVISTVQTTGSSSIRNISAIVSGNISAWGGTDVVERGVVWSVSNNPTITDNKIASGSGLGSFQAYIDGLIPETTYHARAYAINSTGIAYGSELIIKTKVTDPNVIKTISQDGTGDYSTVQEAFDAVPLNYTGKWVMQIKPGIYNERPSLAKGKVNVYLIGEDAATTVITHNTSAGTEKPEGGILGTSNCQTVEILADDFMAVNITVENTFVNTKVNATINSNTQAVALKTQGDRQSFYGCRITGYQDTYLGNSIGRAYFKDCYIEGNVDFIFGRQTVIFDQCVTYVNRDESVLTAPSTEKTTKFGMVFLDCDLTAPTTDYVDFDGKTFKTFYFGRPWQQQPKSAFIRCNTPATLNEKGWTTMNGGLSPIFVEYACTGEGATDYRTSKRANEGVVLSNTEADVYMVSNIFKKETDPTFSVDWMPEPALDIDDVITSIVPNIADELSSYSFPNPFVDMCTIYYTLANDANVEINLYDIHGKLLNKLAQNIESAGLHSIDFNGSHLASGVYFYSIQTDKGIETQKIIKR